MAQLYIAEPLSKLLEFWEDCNLSGEFMFQVGLITPGGHRDDDHLKALVGSELNKIGVFARSISEYEKLRGVLGGTSYVHPNNFLPRIPKDLKARFAGKNELFIDHDLVKNPPRIPQYLLKWNETRKACIVEDTVPLPIIDLREENWFNKLPYHSFFLKLTSPFVFHDTDGAEWSVSNLLIFEDNECVRVLAWPDEIERMLLSEDDRKKVKEGIADLKRGKMPKKAVGDIAAKVHDWFLTTLTIRKGTTNILSVKGADPKVLEFDLYDPSAWTVGNENLPDHYARIKVMVEAINGFCKLMATLPPAQAPKVVEHVSTKPSMNPPRQWFELPMQTVEYFHTDNENVTVVIRRGSGTEKSPHYRRGHYRRHIQRDGTEVRVWIAEVIVREDKLVIQQLQGGAIKVKV